MAYTVDQSSGTGVQGAYDEIFYVVRDTVNYNDPKFRYLLKVTIDGTVVGTFKQLPNNNDCAVFLIEQIVSSYVHQDDNIWFLGKELQDGTLSTTKIFSRNLDAIKTVLVDFGYEKAADADSAPTETWGAAAQASFKVINGSIRSQSHDADDTNSAAAFGMINSNGAFITTLYKNQPGSIAEQYVDEDQWGAMAFLNGDDVGSDDPNYFHVTFYNSAGVAQETGYFQNNSTNGGYTPAAGLSDGRSLIYFGCFPANLDSQTIDADLKPSTIQWDYYDVQAASSTTLSGNEASQIYRFHKLCSNRYTEVSKGVFPGTYQLVWWNELGGVDNLIFDGASNVSQQIKRETYYSIGGNAFNAGNTIDYNRRPNEGGTTSAGNQTTTSITLNTREQNPEALSGLIMSLASSPRVHISIAQQVQQSDILGKGVQFVRCVITDMSVSYSTAVNDKIANYTITVQISRRRPNNR